MLQAAMKRRYPYMARNRQGMAVKADRDPCMRQSAGAGKTLQLRRRRGGE
ncbi:hypothetical protein [Paenibacillus sp. FSL R7-0333]